MGGAAFMKTNIDTDALLADAWLTVTELRHGARLAEGEGEALWQRCVDDIERVMKQLEQADVSEASRRHILYAWCALLENVKLVKVAPKMHDIKDPAYEKHNHLEQIELRYEKITWTYKDGNIIHSDSWNERATA